MDPLHVIPKLFQVFNVAIADFADDKVALAPTLAGSRLTRFHRWSRRTSLRARRPSAGQGGDGD